MEAVRLAQVCTYIGVRTVMHGLFSTSSHCAHRHPPPPAGSASGGRDHLQQQQRAAATGAAAAREAEPLPVPEERKVGRSGVRPV